MNTRPMVFARGPAKFTRMLSLLSLWGEERGRPSSRARARRERAGWCAAQRGGPARGTAGPVGVRGAGRRGASSPPLNCQWPARGEGRWAGSCDPVGSLTA